MLFLVSKYSQKLTTYISLYFVIISFPLMGSFANLLKDQDQIVLQFKDKNPNGSMEAITSVCDESGLVCAMMPHPERACEEILGSSDGLNFFKGFL